MNLFLGKAINILEKKLQFKLKKIIFFNSLIFIFEFISLSILPLFASALIDIKFTKKKISNLFSFESIDNFDDTQIINYLGALAVLFFILKNLYYFFIIKYQANFFSQMKKSLSQEIFLKYIYLPYEKFIMENSSILVRNLISEIQSVYGYLHNLMSLFREIVAIFVIFIILSIVDIKFTIFLSFILVIFTLIYHLATKVFIKKAAIKNQSISSSLIKILNETFGSFKEIKIRSKEKDISNLYFKNLSIFENNLKKFYIFEKLPKIFLELLILILLIAVSLFMIEVDKSENFLPQLAILLILSFRFLPAFNAINASLTYLKIFQPSVYLIYNKKQELNFYLENNFKNIKNVNQIFDKSLDKKEISLKNVSYRYPDQKEYILKNLNIEINRGEKIGISGTTGCGKSTLLYLMMGLIKPSEGKIFYNGKDNCNDEIKLSEKISYVPQIPFLHDTSIKKNIVFDFSEEENLNSLEIKKIEELVKLTLLDDKVRALPEGLDSKVGDNAVKLSGGEKQRVAIARSLYKNFDLLFLDEFTSSLDSITEEKIIQNLINKYSEKTMIIISHKSKTLQMCDRIINLDKKNDN